MNGTQVDQLKRAALAPGECQRLSELVGETVISWIRVAETVTGQVVLIAPEDQAPSITADLLADAAHCLNCGGCEHCSS